MPAEKPEPEWVSRFFDIAAGITTEQLQYLWGRILAGEIKQPGSFSLRTLDVLRNLSRKEAESFVKLGSMGEEFTMETKPILIRDPFLQLRSPQPCLTG